MGKGCWKYVVRGFLFRRDVSPPILDVWLFDPCVLAQGNIQEWAWMMGVKVVGFG